VMGNGGEDEAREAGHARWLSGRAGPVD
jgi:hypothetical protein